MISSEDLPPGSMQDLVRAKSREERKGLIGELRREGSERSVALLLEVLEDESWSLREMAVDALVATPELAAPRLMKLLDEGLWYSRAAAMRALGDMGHAPALPRLLALLDDTNSTIAAESGRALLALARRGQAVAVTRGILARGDAASPTFARLDRVDPDATRKLRILANREEIAEPVSEWLAREEGPERESAFAALVAERDTTLGVEWDRISGPVGD